VADTDDGGKPFNNPFGALGTLRPKLPSGPEPPPVAAGPTVGPAPTRAHVRLERKGRGGKEVTVVERLELAAPEAEALARELKQALGCGGVVEGGALVFQGDQRQRLADLLRVRGVRKVTVG
jgi:translation initiation factor 1